MIDPLKPSLPTGTRFFDRILIGMTLLSVLQRIGNVWSPPPLPEVPTPKPSPWQAHPPLAVPCLASKAIEATEGVLRAAPSKITDAARSGWQSGASKVTDAAGSIFQYLWSPVGGLAAFALGSYLFYRYWNGSSGINVTNKVEVHINITGIEPCKIERRGNTVNIYGA